MIITKSPEKKYFSVYYDSKAGEACDLNGNREEFNFKFKVNLSRCIQEKIYFIDIKLYNADVISAPALFEESVSFKNSDLVKEDIESYNARLRDFITTKNIANVFKETIDLKGFVDLDFVSKFNKDNYDTLLKALNKGVYEYSLDDNFINADTFEIDDAQIQNTIINKNQEYFDRYFENEITSEDDKRRFSLKEISNGLDNLRNKNLFLEKNPKTGDLFVIIDKTISLDKDIFDENSFINNHSIFFDFSLKNNQKVVFQKVIRRLFEKEEGYVFFMPERHNALQVSQDQVLGKTVISVVGNCPKAKKIKLYVKEVHDKKAVALSKFRLINTFNIEDPTVEYYFNYYAPNNRNLIFRAVSIGRFGVLGNGYTEKVFFPKKETRNYIVANTQYKNSILYHENLSDGVLINVEDIPPEVVAIRLYKRNAGRKEASFKYLSDSYKLLTGRERIYSYKDQNVRYDNIYEYKSVFIYNNGSEIDGEKLFLRYIPVKNTSVALKIKNQSFDPRSLNFEFDVDADFLTSEIDYAKQYLENNGYLSYFTNDLLNQREDLTNLYAYIVERLDLTTGERVFYKPITLSERFISEKHDAVSGVSPVAKNRRYRYFINLSVRNPEDLVASDKEVRVIKDIQENISIDEGVAKLNEAIASSVDSLKEKDRKKLVREFIDASNRLAVHYNIKKWADYKIKKLNFIPDQNISYSRITSRDGFALGQTGIYTDLYLNTDSIDIFLDNFNAKRYGLDSVLLSWTIKGDQENIDRFIIFCKEQESLFKVGEIHPDPSKDSYNFIDQIGDERINSISRDYQILVISNSYSKIDQKRISTNFKS